MKKTLAVLSLLAALSFAAFGQTIISSTTLAAAVTSTSATTVRVTSATGMTATSTLLFVDNEAMFVNAINSTTVSVTRGYFGGRAVTHANGALVWFGPPPAFGWATPSGYPSGSCARATMTYLPYINTDNGVISDCIGGVWVSGGSSTGSYNSFFRLYLPNPGAVLYTGINTNGVAPSGTTSMNCSELDIPASKYATGLAVLNGTTVGTDKHILILYDSTGNLVANSATAGATSSSASAYQTYAFTTPYYVVGPAKYYGCLQTNGVTDTIRMLITSVQDGTTTKAQTGQVFGTIATTFTVPTTFTTAVGPYYQLY